MNNSHYQKHIRLIGVFFLSLSASWLIVFLYSVHSAMPHNAVQLPLEKSLPIVFFLPQGWSFFTRNPRESDHLVYSKDANGKWISVIQPNASPKNLFGISRSGRAVSVEMGLLLTSLNDKGVKWTECKKSLKFCADRLSVKTELVNKSPDAQICGEVIFSEQPPIPWAWSTSRRKIVMPSKLVETNIVCQQ